MRWGGAGQEPTGRARGSTCVRPPDPADLAQVPLVVSARLQAGRLRHRDGPDERRAAAGVNGPGGSGDRTGRATTTPVFGHGDVATARSHPPRAEHVDECVSRTVDLVASMPRHWSVVCDFHDERDSVVRYADGPSAEAEAVIDAPVARVWKLVSDIELPARFSEEFQGARWIDDRVGVGARFVGRNAHAALGEWETTSWVTRWEPARAFGWSVTDPDDPSATWWFLLDEVDGKVRLRHGGRMGPAPSGLSIAIAAMPDKEERIVARRIEEWACNLQATVDGIKHLAEAQQ